MPHTCHTQALLEKSLFVTNGQGLDELDEEADSGGGRRQQANKADDWDEDDGSGARAGDGAGAEAAGGGGVSELEVCGVVVLWCVVIGVVSLSR